MHSFLIRTEILPFDPQAGMKSEQTLEVDFVTRLVRSTFRTGRTHLGPISLGSVRNSFSVTGVVFSASTVRFTAIGSTATGVHVLPSIDYSMRFEVTSAGTGWVDGTHDGYPAYTLAKDARVIYSYRHRPMQLWRLAGNADVSFARRAF